MLSYIKTMSRAINFTIVLVLLIAIACETREIYMSISEGYRVCRKVRTGQGGSLNQEREICDGF